MPCGNLIGELAKKKIKNSVANKLNGDSPFTIEEAFKIQATFFPKLSLEYLFDKDEEGA